MSEARCREFNVGFGEGFRSASMSAVFDAEADSLALLEQVEKVVPQIRDLMASMRRSLPLAPHSGVGPIGQSSFYRLPSHYRSLSYVLGSVPPTQSAGGGVIVFKGTEPLLADFSDYFAWMMEAPFRTSMLPLGLHFPLDMKLPPGGMWIEECIAEQRAATNLQQRYFERYGRLARLPVPLFVFRFSEEQNSSYQAVVRSRLPDDAIHKIQKKLADGLGVEVYYYPELPLRAADLFVGNVRETFASALVQERIEMLFESWTKLLAEILCLEVMPFAAWHHGMGACVDPGNVCLDGGFSDLLTLVSFDAFASDAVFRSGLLSSVKLLAESMVSTAAASLGVAIAGNQDATSLAEEYVRNELQKHVMAHAGMGYAFDERLLQFFMAPGTDNIFNALRSGHFARTRPSQYLVTAKRPELPPARHESGEGEDAKVREPSGEGW